MGLLPELLKKYGGAFLAMILCLMVTGSVLWSKQSLSPAQGNVQISTDTKLLRRLHEEPRFKIHKEAWKQGSDLVVNIDIRGQFTSTGQTEMDMDMEIKDSQRDTSANRGELLTLHILYFKVSNIRVHLSWESGSERVSRRNGICAQCHVGFSDAETR